MSTDRSLARIRPDVQVSQQDTDRLVLTGIVNTQAQDIEESFASSSLEKVPSPAEMFRKERTSFKLNKSSKGL